jgi:hypothetical protein
MAPNGRKKSTLKPRGKTDHLGGMIESPLLYGSIIYGSNKKTKKNLGC